MQTRWTVAYCLLGSLFPCSPLPADEEQDEIPSKFEEILSDSREMSPGALWQQIIESDFEISSLPGHRHGHFEVIAIGTAPDRKRRCIHEVFDDDGRVRTKLSLDFGGLPKGIGVDDTVVSLNESGDWKSIRPAKWSFVVDGTHLSNYNATDLIPAGADVHIRFHPNSFLAGIMGHNHPDTSWDEATRTLEAVRPNGAIARVQFRTPHDQRRFGTILSEVRAFTPNGVCLSFRNFIVDEESPLRLAIDDIDSLPNRLDAEDVTANPSQLQQLQFMPPAAMKSANRLMEELQPLECRDIRPVAKVAAARSRFQEMMILYSIHVPGNVKPTLEANRPYRGLEGQMDRFIEELEIGYPLIEAAITEGTDDPIVDDPNLIWLGFERAVNPQTAMLSIGGIIDLLRSEHVPQNTKIRLCMAIGELGPPEWGVAGFPSLGANGPFLRAVLEARWSRNPMDDQIALCHAKLDDDKASPLEREAAIDSLIRWGKLKDVRPEQMDDWLEAQLAASDTHRHCTWKALTRTPDGRQFLRERLESPAFPAEARREIVAMLRLRASASLDMKRFDFMSEDECRETLKVCDAIGESRSQVDGTGSE